MPLITIHVHADVDNEKVLREINQLKKLIMGKVEELNEKIDGLQTTLDQVQETLTTKQAQDAATILGLEQTVADLQAIIDAGGNNNEEALAAIIVKVDAIKADLQSTISPAPDPEA